MSMFKVVSIACPACAAPIEFNAVFSVNADRRPDLRAAVLDGSFQRTACPQCSAGFRLDPEFTFIDQALGLWIGVFPYVKIGEWQALEEQARNTFNRAYGERASAAARNIGAGLKPRIVFGWSALREKLVVAQAGLDDVMLELMKTAMIRGMDKPPLGPGTELRLVSIEEKELVVAWINAENESVRETLRVPRPLYEDIVSDPGPWLSLRTSLTAGPFVDMNRLLIAAPV